MISSFLGELYEIDDEQHLYAKSTNDAILEPDNFLDYTIDYIFMFLNKIFSKIYKSNMRESDIELLMRKILCKTNITLEWELFARLMILIICGLGVSAIKWSEEHFSLVLVRCKHESFLVLGPRLAENSGCEDYYIMKSKTKYSAKQQRWALLAKSGEKNGNFDLFPHSLSIEIEYDIQSNNWQDVSPWEYLDIEELIKDFNKQGII